jgi:hypothetical protein
MPLFEVEVNGEIYEVDAPDEQKAVAAFQQPAQASQDAQGSTIRQGGIPSPTGNFDPNATKAVASAIGSGIMEGGRRIGGALGQLAGNATDFYNAVVKGTPFKAADITDPQTGQIIRGTAAEDSAGRNATAKEILRQTLDKAESVEKGVDQGIRAAAAGATELGAAALLPEAALPRATTFMSGVIKNTLSNTAGSFMLFDADNKQAQDVALGAVSAPAVSLLTASGPATLNKIGRHLQGVLSGSRTEGATLAARNALPTTDFTLAQITGIPELKSLERAAYDSKMVKYYADQTDSIIKDFGTILSIPPSTSNKIDTAFAKAKTGADQRLKGIKGNASQAWDKGLAEAAAIDNTVIGGVRVPAQNFRQRFDVEKQVMGDPLANLQKDPVSQRTLRKLQDALYDAEGNPKDLTAPQVASLLKGLTAVQREGSPAAKAFATRMRISLDTDLDLLESTPALRANLAVKKILDTRGEYRRAMGVHAAYANSTAYKLMGVGDDVDDVSPQDLIGRFKAFDPARQREVTKYMEEHAPAMLEGMKNEAIGDVLRRSGKVGPAADSGYDLDRFVEALTNPSVGDEIRTIGLWNPQELKKLDSVMSGVRVIYNNRPGLGSAGTQIKPEDIAPNLVSRSGIFIARQATRIFMSVKASQFFTDPKVQELLTKANRSTTGSTANLAARAALLELMQTEYATTPEEEQQ